MRLIFKNEHSYADMAKEVAAIEKEEKNSLCLGLIRLVDPEKLEEEVTKEMNGAYAYSFEDQWSKEQLYKNVYRYYLSELKYFVKGMEQ